MNLSQAQADFLQADTRGRIYVGSLGSGKTLIMCLAAIMEASKGRYTLIASFSYRNLKDVVFKTLKDIAEQLGIPYTANIGDMTFTINNTPILLRSANEPDRLRSYNLHSFFIEEAREVSREAFDILLGRLRNSEDCFWGLVSTTRGKNWFYDIINAEKLAHVFDGEVTTVTNDNLTVSRQPIDESPFLPQAYIDDLKKQYTSSFAQQELQALIVDFEGALISTDWFNISDFSSDNHSSGVRFWDLAVTIKKTSDYSCGCLLRKDNSNKFEIIDMKQHKLKYPDLKKLIIETALKDTSNITLGIEGSGQQMAIVDDLRRESALSNHVIRTIKPTRDKISRALPWISQCELGNFTVNNMPFKRAFFDECTRFSPENIGKGHDDMVDSLTGAYEMLVKPIQVQMIRSNLMGN